MHIFLTIITLLAMATLHRVRGDDRWMRIEFDPMQDKRIPGRALFYVTPLVGLVALLTQSWQVALAQAAGYFFFAVWGWGHVLAKVGGFTPPREATGLDKILAKLPGKFLPVFARMLFILPMTIATAYLTGLPHWLLTGVVQGIFFAGLAAVLYRILFRKMDKTDWAAGEITLGAMIGSLILPV